MRTFLAPTFLFAVAAILVGAASYKAFPLKPADESASQADFKAFHDKFLGVVKNKDTTALLELVDPNIKVGYGAEEGVAAFKRHWKLDQSPADSPLWAKLGRILEMGGVFQKDTFVSPYLLPNWPSQFKKSEYGAITGKNVNVRSRPAADAPVVKQSSYDIVRFLFDSFSAAPTTTINGETWSWVKIALPNGAEGYVWGKFFYGPLDYRAGFRKVGDGWKMTYLVSGE